jgi:DNA-binding IclR family transcriptional regulator
VANRAALRALSILDLLSRSEEPLTLGEVATLLKLPKSSALTLLRALVVTEFCTADEKGFYALGLHSFEVGAAYLRSMTPVRSVTPELQWLTESLGVTSHFAVLDHDEVTYLAKHDPPGLGLKLASSLGARLPAAVTAVGKAQLAFRAPGPGNGGPTAHEMAGADEAVPSGFERELERVRTLGYAVDDGQTAVGIRCVAAPLFNDRGCCGALGVSYLLGGEPAVATVVEALMEAAGRASARLGGRGAPRL